MKLTIKSIVIGPRQRIDLGDCHDLAASLADVGLIQAIGVNEKNVLIWGRRRLEAATLLGWEEIECVQRVGLTPAMEQEIEYEEDFCRKNRTWQEGCIAVAALKRAKEKRTGEEWSLRKMADFTGLGKSSLGYMMQVAAGLNTEPKDDELWACENYLSAIKLLLARTHRLVSDELERRRERAASVVLPTKTNDPSSVQQLDTTQESESFSPVVINIQHEPIAFHDAIEGEHFLKGRAACIIGYNVPGPTIVNIAYAIHDFGFAVLFFDEPACPLLPGLIRMPYPLIWNNLSTVESEWPYTKACVYGYVLTRYTPAKHSCLPNVISATTYDPSHLPPSIVESVVDACCLPDMPVFCIGGVRPVDVAVTGHTPIFFEPNALLAETYIAELINHYEELIPGVVCKLPTPKKE